jgi:cytochrome c-type biogenesis protein
MDASKISLGLAFFAGFLSFISPCVLPLIPAYISYLGGRATMEISGQQTAIAGAVTSVGVAGGTASTVKPSRIATLLHGIFFVGGFTLVFVLFGMLTNAGIQSIRAVSYDVQIFITQAGGFLIILFGLHVLGVTGWLLKMLITRVAWDDLDTLGENIRGGLERLQGVIYGDTRMRMNPRNPYGLLGSSMMGIIFAAGWTPCIGPIYGGILTMAATSNMTGSTGHVVVLLLAYSLGLGMPFLLAAVMLDRMRGLMARLKKQMRVVEIISGVFLIVIGVLLFTNRFSYLNQMASGLADFSANVESCSINLVENKMPLSDLGKCLNDVSYIPPQS